MAEQIVNGYKRLFEVRLLHHYWLDEGKDVFDSLTEPVRNKRLLTYDVRPFLAVVPTTSTEQRLKGLRCVFKTTALGFVVAVPRDVEIPADALFEFVLTVQHSDFFNYTALTLRKQHIYELYHRLEDKTYRFKENVFVFSNESGASRGAGANKVLFLSTEIPASAPTDQIESLFLSIIDANLPFNADNAALEQVISEAPGATPQLLNGVAANLPVFVHQADAPTIVPPIGLTGTPAKGIELTKDLPDDLFALIRIRNLVPTNEFSLLSAPSVLRSPVFEIRFKNRSTAWKYFDKKTGLPDTATPILLPLTHFGNATTTKQKPSEGLVRAVSYPADPTKVTGLVSDIFV